MKTGNANKFASRCCKLNAASEVCEERFHYIYHLPHVPLIEGDISCDCSGNIKARTGWRLQRISKQTGCILDLGLIINERKLFDLWRIYVRNVTITLTILNGIIYSHLVETSAEGVSDCILFKRKLVFLRERMPETDNAMC